MIKRAIPGQPQAPQLGPYKGPQSAEPTLIPNAPNHNSPDYPMPKRPKLPEGYSPNRPVEATPVGMDELIKKLSSMPDMPDQEFFGIRETAQLLGVQYNTVLKLIMNSGIRAYKIGGQWKITKNDFRGYLEQHSNQRGEPESARPESPLEALLHDLDANDPEDYRFRQELDSYIADRLSEVSQMHPLWKKRYTKRVVSEEVNTLLEGRFGVLDDSIGTGSSTQRGKPESALPKLLPDELVKSLDPKNPAYSMLMEAVKSYNEKKQVS